MDGILRIPGIWWLSDNPDKQVAGDLLISDRKLELNGSFEGMKTGAFGGGPSRVISVRQDKTIQGVARKGGKRYTLEYFDEPSSTTISTPGYKADTYMLGNIFEGCHFEKTEDLSFERYYAEFPYLLDWVNVSVISTTMTVANGQKFGETTIKVHPPKTIEIFKNKDFKLSFVITPSGVKFGAGVQEMNLGQTCSLKLEAVKGELNLHDANSIISHFERFLIIAVGRSLSMTKYQASSGKGVDASTATIFLHSSRRKEEDEYPFVSVHSMNFGLFEINANIQTIFEKWFEDKDKYADIFNLFSAIRSDSPKILENQFKDIVSAIEGYVRLEQGNLDITLDRAIKIVNEAVPKDDRPLAKEDYKKVRITRNKLSHIAIKPEDQNSVLDDHGKWLNFQKLLFLLEYSLLKNLGLSDDMLNKFYSKRKTWG